MANAKIDENSRYALIVVDADDNEAVLRVTGQNLTNSTPIHVALVDASGDQIVSFGGGSQYVEDAAAAANPTGTVPILIRTDTPATQVTTDGDNVAQRGTNYGAAYVQLVTSAGAYIDSVGGGTEYTEDVITANPQIGKAIMVERDDQLAAVTPIEGDWIGLRGTGKGALWVALADSSGDPITSFGGGIQYSDGDANADPTGTVAMGTDGSNIFALHTDTSGDLQVDVLTMPTVAVTGTFWQATQPVSGTFWQATQPVSIAATVTVDGSGVTQPVSNAGLTELAAAINISSQMDVNIAASSATVAVSNAGLTALNGAISGTEVQVDVITMPTTTVTATNLDIRDLTSASDSILIYGSDDGGTTKRVIKTDSGGAIQVDLEVTSVTVTSGNITADTELTTADLDTGAGTDTRAVVGLVGTASGGGQLIPGSSTDGLLVNLGTNNDVVVSATDLDIRNLTSTDVVTVTGGAGQTADVKITLDSESVAVTNAGITTIAGAVAGTEMQVDVLTMPTVAVTGTFWQATQPVSIAGTVTVDSELTTADLDTGAGTDTRAVVGLVGSASGGGALIPGSATDGLLVNLGTNNDVTLASTTITGTVAVTQSGTWDEVGINDSGNAITVDWAGTAPPIGAGLEATALRVTVATDSTGVLSVDDNGGALTVDGTVTANLSATDNAVLDAIEADTTTIAGAVSGTEMQVDVITMPSVTIGTFPDNEPFNVAQWGGNAVTAGAGAVAAGTPRITHASDDPTVTALQIIDNIVSGSEAQVDVVAALPAGTNAIGKLLQPDIDVTTNSNYAKKYYTSAGAVTDGIIWSPAAGKRWHIHTIYINVSAAATITLEDDLAAGDSAIWKGELAANSGVVMTFPEKYPWASGEDAADLIITTSAGNVYVTCSGMEI